AIYHKAEGVYLTNSALEKITPGSEHFRYMMRFLKENMLDQEIQRIMSLMHDPDSPKGKKRSDKYHYKTTEKYFALALKLMFLLPQVDRLQRSGMDATLYSEKGNENGQNYNNPDHFLKASRK
ncbi:MAG: hypothetical protein KKC05_02780, partial [Nanoarchaeota archaeon]|nr:hypothetical protein [Nanoarchaeota archaeon]